MHPCSESIQLAIFSKQQVMVLACGDLLYSKAICEHFNRLFSMHIHTIANTKLAILVEPN